MFYQLNVIFHETGDRQLFNFEHYESGYAFASRRANEILQHAEDLRMASDREHKNFDKGSYCRTIKLVTADKGRDAVTLTLQGAYFEDALVEQFPDQYAPTDFPPKQ